MSVDTMEEALLRQQLEFLQLELDESKNRENSLRALNKSLLETLKSSEASSSKLLPLQEQTILELQQTNNQLNAELNYMKEKAKRTQSEHESQVHSLSLQNKELRLEIKEMNLEKGSHNNLNLPEEENAKILSLELHKKRLEEEIASLRCYYESKIKDIKNNSEKTTTEYEIEMKELRENHEKQIKQLRDILTNENDQLREQFSSIKNKMKDKLKENNLPDDIETNDAVYINHLLKKIQDLEKVIEKKDKQFELLELKLEDSVRRKEKVEVDFCLTSLELKQQKLDLCPFEEKQSLREDIKGIIGKLIKTKDKIRGEVNPTIKKHLRISHHSKSII